MKMTRSCGVVAVALVCLPAHPATANLSTFLGNGLAGFSDTQVNNPYGLVLGPDGALYFCDLDNQRIRRLDLATKRVTTIAGTGEAKPTPEDASVSGTPLKGPRTMAAAPNGDLYLALREGNAIYRIDANTQTLHRVAGTGEQGYSGDGGDALSAKLAGPKGLAYAPGDVLYIADTENHVIRTVNLKTGIISTVLGTGVRGDGPEADPLTCKLARPHGVLFASGSLYVSDSESHRIRVLR